jgi:hypothetical protein
MVIFAAATEEVVGEAMTLAWQSLGRQASKDSSMRRQKTKRIGRTR